MLPTAKTQAPGPDPAAELQEPRQRGRLGLGAGALPAAQAEEGGAYVLTETSATQLIVEDGQVVGVRSGDKGRGKDGEELGNFEPGTDIKARVTVLAEGCWGHLTGAAIKRVRPRPRAASRRSGSSASRRSGRSRSRSTA